MPRVTEQHRAARRERILAAAMRCVAREGFHKTTMAHVIAESGASAGAVYGHFKGKADLIRALSDFALSGLGEALAELESRPGPLDPAEVLEQLLDRVQTLASAYEVDLTRVAVQAWAEACRDEEVRLVVASRLSDVRERWGRVLQRCQRDGTLDPTADPHAVAQTMVGLLPGYVVQRLILRDVTPESYVAGFRSLTGSPSAPVAAEGASARKVEVTRRSSSGARPGRRPSGREGDSGEHTGLADQPAEGRSHAYEDLAGGGAAVRG